MFGPLWPTIYDFITRTCDRGGFGTMRHELVRDALGATIEIGAGTGGNLAHYPPDLERLVLAEPVRSDDPKLARRQDRQRRFYNLVVAGCNPNRDTITTVQAAGFTVDEIRSGEIPKAPAVERPLIIGAARLG